MTAMISEVKSGSVTFAARNSNVDGIEIKKDDIMGLVEGKIKVITKDVAEAVVEVLENMEADSSSTISLYYGEDVSEDEANKVSALVEEKISGADVNVYNGGQPLYYYYISVE